MLDRYLEIVFLLLTVGLNIGLIYLDISIVGAMLDGVFW